MHDVIVCVCVCVMQGAEDDEPDTVTTGALGWMTTYVWTAVDGWRGSVCSRMPQTCRLFKPRQLRVPCRLRNCHTNKGMGAPNTNCTVHSIHIHMRRFSPHPAINIQRPTRMHVRRSILRAGRLLSRNRAASLCVPAHAHVRSFAYDAAAAACAMPGTIRDLWDDAGDAYQETQRSMWWSRRHPLLHLWVHLLSFYFL